MMREANPTGNNSDIWLGSVFWRSYERFRDRPALFVHNQMYSYGELGSKAEQMANLIHRVETGNEQEVAAVFASRSFTAYAGILGILTAGRGYVPLNPKFPLERTLYMLETAKVTTLVVGFEALEQLDKLLPLVKRPLNIISPWDDHERRNMETRHPNHLFFGTSDLEHANEQRSLFASSGEEIAYLLFTSGSTGKPKGVPVSHRNVVSYLEFVADLYQFHEQDRFSQMFDLTFDLSVHDMFVCWGSGACLYTVPEQSVMSPAKFLKEHELTVWFSVPSVPLFMQKLRLLKPNSFPSLRYSFFCGEALPQAIAEAWQSAANNSIVENLYGPTEATIAISRYRWDSIRSPEECKNGLVPIGQVFPTQEWRVLTGENQKASDGEVGELFVSGTQITTGYLYDEEKTKQAYVILPDKSHKVWYRTGDLVSRSESNDLVYHGRIDNQFQIMGYRVEIQEIEHVLLATGAAFAVALPMLTQNGKAEGIYAFLPNEFEAKQAEVLDICRAKLPDYMIPRKLIFVEDVPLNPNGKIDRKELMKQMEGLQ